MKKTLTTTRNRQKIRTAFTMVELLVVMAIIAVLFSLTMPAIMRVREISNRTQCTNNLRQMGVAFNAYHQQLNSFPTAGLNDYSAPNYMGTSGTTTVGSSTINTLTSATLVTGHLQEAGWTVQILPYMDAEVIATGNNSLTALANVQALMGTPFKFNFCPSRRGMTTSNYNNAAFPAQPVYPNSTSSTTILDYSSLQNKHLTVALIDYAACNGNTTNAASLNSGAVRSQSAGQNLVTISMIKDGMSHTMLLGEKAVNMSSAGSNLNEDDIGYFSAFSSANYNNIRFTSPSLLPVTDGQLTSVSGGAFGSAHPGGLNALMADGAVQNISYTINPTVYSGLGTIAGREVITDQDVGF